jgi:hypothetical protein
MYEETNEVTEKTLNIRRAIDSLREEVQAVDLYNQRADATSDEELKKVLLHNAKEEKEHSAMLIEWLRKNDSEFEEELKEYLFKS